MAEFIEWRVRKESGFRRFSDGLVVQESRAGALGFSACRLTGSRTSPEETGLLGPLAAACASEGIRRDTGVVSWLHWPDLVTIEGRVVARTSLSVASSPESRGELQVTFGVSVNCFAGRQGVFPPGLPATSIFDVLGVEIDPDLLRDKILHALDWYYAEWARGKRRKLVERMSSTIEWLGREVEVMTVGGKELRGNARGLDDNGSLLLAHRDRDGSTKTRALRPESVELVRAVK